MSLLALAVVDAPCQRPGETTTCASYVEYTAEPALGDGHHDQGDDSQGQ
jgi:hypothetical protein